MFTSGHLRLPRRNRLRAGRRHGFRSAAAVLLLGLLTAATLSAQPQPSPQVWRLPAGAHIIAKLRTSIDTRYTVENSSVVAVVVRDVKQHGHVLIPKGTQLLGRVLVSHPARKGQPAALQVQFQQALLANGNTLTVSAGISSVFTRARRAALDRSNGIGAAPVGPMANGAGENTAPASPSYRGSRAMPMPETPSTAPDFAGPADDHAAGQADSAPHPPGGLRDSDGVPLRIVSTPNDAGAGTMLTGSGPTIRINAGTRIEVKIFHSVPVPAATDH